MTDIEEGAGTGRLEFVQQDSILITLLMRKQMSQMRDPGRENFVCITQ